MATDTSVCVVGYGPTGAILANLLGQYSVSTIVIERQAAPYDLPRAVHFDAEAMRVFQTIGLAERILPTTHVSPGTRFVDRHGRVLVDWSRPMEVGPQGWHMSYRFHQPELERILREGADRFRCVGVRECCEFLGAEQTGSGVTVRVRSLKTGEVEVIRCQYLVGADGARSKVRDELIGTEAHDLNFNQDWLVVDVRLTRPMPELGEHSIQFCVPERPTTYVRGIGDRRRFEVALRPEEASDEMTSPANIWARLSRWLTPEDATLERAVSYTFRALISRRWRNGRIFIAGDAAHLTPPFLGQGLCAGIRDVANLAWKLIRVLRGQSAPALLDTYDRELIPQVTEYIAEAVRLGEVINTCALRSLTNGVPTGDGGLRIKSIAPSLGPGLAGGWTEPALQIAPQPFLSDGRRADDVAGYGYALFTRATLPVASRRGLSIIADPAVLPWLDELGAEAVLVRPDRYVLGAARNQVELDDLLDAV